MVYQTPSTSRLSKYLMYAGTTARPTRMESPFIRYEAAAFRRTARSRSVMRE